MKNMRCQYRLNRFIIILNTHRGGKHGKHAVSVLSVLSAAVSTTPWYTYVATQVYTNDSLPDIPLK